MEAKSQLFLGYLGYHKDLQTRAAFMEVLTKILQQGTEFDTLAETCWRTGLSSWCSWSL